jgi:hypothetical protein
LSFGGSVGAGLTAADWSFPYASRCLVGCHDAV